MWHYSMIKQSTHTCLARNFEISPFILKNGLRMCNFYQFLRRYLKPDNVHVPKISLLLS